MVWYDPATSYASGGLDRETGQNIPGALWQRLMDSINWLGGAAGNTKSGTLSIPAQPAFQAYNSTDRTNQTGAGAVVTVTNDTEVFDQANNFSANIFTASITGRHRFSASARATAIPAGATSLTMEIVTSNRTYRRSWSFTAGTFTAFSADMSVLADMDAADTAYVTLSIGGGAGNTATISGPSSGNFTFFSGELVA